jgi:hypothetical protein
MSQYDHRRVIACPECETLIFSENLSRHFKKAHRRDLSGAQLVQFLADARKKSVSPRKYFAFIELAYKALDNRPKPERTPPPLRGWMRQGSSGPLGPEKR